MNSPLNLKTYIVSCNGTRRRGALGTYYRKVMMVQAPDPYRAADMFRERYETCRPVRVKENTNDTPRR